MNFLTEEDVRKRGIEPGGIFRLTQSERLTPAAAEYLQTCKVKMTVNSSCSEPVSYSTPAGENQACAENCHGLTWLDNSSRVPKSHPRIEFRGRLDSLLAECVLLQNSCGCGGFPPILRGYLEELSEIFTRILYAEVSGAPFTGLVIGGMDADILHTVACAPQKYLGVEHILPAEIKDLGLARLNRLRALVRELEVFAIKAGIERCDLLDALNRLSSGVYVIMLLSIAAGHGRTFTDLVKK